MKKKEKGIRGRRKKKGLRKKKEKGIRERRKQGRNERI